MHIEFIKKYQNVPIKTDMHVPNDLGQQWINEGYAINLTKKKNGDKSEQQSSGNSNSSRGKKSPASSGN